MAKLADTGAFFGAMADPIMRQLILRQQLEDRARMANQQNEMQKLGFATNIAQMMGNRQMDIAKMAQAMQEGKANRLADLRNRVFQHINRLDEIEAQQNLLRKRESDMRKETRDYQEEQKTMSYETPNGQTVAVTPKEYAQLLNAEAQRYRAVGANQADFLSYSEAQKLVDHLLAAQAGVGYDTLSKRPMSAETADLRRRAIDAVRQGVPVELAVQKELKGWLGRKTEDLKSFGSSIFSDEPYEPDYYDRNVELSIGGQAQTAQTQPMPESKERAFRGIDLSTTYASKKELLNALAEAGATDDEISELSRRWDLIELRNQATPR
jgi:hypothetical protein